MAPRRTAKASSPVAVERPRRGRRPAGDGPSARDEIVAAARAAFAAAGYDGTSVRQIAAAAGVDPALVHHYFGAKRGLFVATLQLTIRPDTVLARFVDGPLDEMGERMVRTFLGVWAAPENRLVLVGLLRSAASDAEAAGLVRTILTREIFAGLAAHLEADADPADAALRVTLVGSQLIGLAVARYVVAIPPLATADDETLVAALAPTVQRYLTGRLDGGAVTPAGATTSRPGRRRR